jgi:hypothetical protein
MDVSEGSPISFWAETVRQSEPVDAMSGLAALF